MFVKEDLYPVTLTGPFWVPPAIDLLMPLIALNLRSNVTVMTVKCHEFLPMRMRNPSAAATGGDHSRAFTRSDKILTASALNRQVTATGPQIKNEKLDLPQYDPRYRTAESNTIIGNVWNC